MYNPDDIDGWLRIWASFARQTEDVGWYRQQPWYTEINLAWPDDSERLTDYDRAMASRVESVVGRMAVRDMPSYTALRQYYGAYPGANPDRAERIAALVKSGVPRREVYRAVRDARRIIEGAVLYG